jgi:hypothetical protein
MHLGLKALGLMVSEYLLVEDPAPCCEGTSHAESKGASPPPPEAVTGSGDRSLGEVEAGTKQASTGSPRADGG